MSKHEETHYRVGDVFIRTYNNVKWLCILVSRDYNKTYKKYVWKSTMNVIYNTSELFGGENTGYYEEDLEQLQYIGNVTALL
jgi:hypothetical protein